MADIVITIAVVEVYGEREVELSFRGLEADPSMTVMLSPTVHA